MPPERYGYGIDLEDDSGNLQLEDGSGIILLETPALVLQNYERVKAPDGYWVGEIVR